MPLIFKFDCPFAENRLYKNACSIVSGLRAHGKQAYFAGGSVRDMLAGHAPHDIDIATDALPDEIQRIFPLTHAVGAAFGVITVHIDSIQYEVATFREEREYSDGRRPDRILYTSSAELDVLRRDFTINGMLYDPQEKTVIDHVGGMADMRSGTVRTIGDPERRFSEDYLRILRAVRFKSRFAFTLDSATRAAAEKNASRLSILSAERIRDELEKILVAPNASDAFRTMLDTGMLKVILPEVAAMDGVEQPPEFHPEGDVFTHTMLMLDKAAHPTPELAWSILFHDIGKPATARIEDDGRLHFYGHEAVGADMAYSVMKRLRFSNTSADRIKLAVARHMTFAAVDRMRRAKWLKLMDAPTFPTELELHRTDCASCHGLLQNYILMLDRYSELSGKPPVPPPLVNGNDLIKIGFIPGAGIGRMLSEIRDLQLEGTLACRGEALAFAEKKMRSL